MALRRGLPLALVLVLAACGGGGSKDSQGTTAATTTNANGCTTVEQPKPATRKAAKPTQKLDPSKTYAVTMQTNCGSFTSTSRSRRPRPRRVVREPRAKGFYNHTIFHRIVPAIIGAAIRPRAASAGPGLDGRQAASDGRYTLGTVAMAKTGRNRRARAAASSSSSRRTAQLPPEYAIVEVKDGLDTVTRIGGLGDASTEQPTEIVELRRRPSPSGDRRGRRARRRRRDPVRRPKQAEFTRRPPALGAPRSRVVVVAGAHPLCGGLTQAQVVQCRRWSDGPGASLRCGLERSETGGERDRRARGRTRPAGGRAADRAPRGRTCRRGRVRRCAQPPRGPDTLCLARRARRGRPGNAGSARRLFRPGGSRRCRFPPIEKGKALPGGKRTTQCSSSPIRSTRCRKHRPSRMRANAAI